MSARILTLALIGTAVVLTIIGAGQMLADELARVALTLLIIIAAGVVLLGLIIAGATLPVRDRARDWLRRWRIRRDGWPATIARHDLRPVGPAMPDPGNPGHVIRLYTVPAGIYATASIGVLIATNGTPRPDGRHDTVAVIVRPGHTDALAAAAAAAGMTREQYAAIAVRT